MDQIIFNLTTSEKRAAIIQDGKVVEILIERPDAYPKAENIYLGRVIKVLPGMQAAFVDIGHEQNGFIHATDLVNDHNQERPINEVIHEGQTIVVQVKREASKNKGPLLTGNIAIPGENLVYLPFGEYVAVSKKLTENGRDQVKLAGEALIEGQEGVIMRTSSAKTSRDKLEEEFYELRHKWHHILGKSKSMSEVHLLFEGKSIIDTALNNHLAKEAELVFDEFKAYQKCKNILSKNYKLSLYKGHENIFSYYQVDASIQKALNQSIWLKNGGHIQIDYTEALTVIDVNTGKFTGKQDRAQAILQTNLLAAEETARQLRLRNISGMVVIDFIRMSDERHRLEVQKHLKTALESDPIQTRIYGFTALGIMELTRQKVRDSLHAIMKDDCNRCQSPHQQFSVKTLFYELERRVHELSTTEEEGVWVELSSELYSYIHENQSDRLEHISNLIPARLFVTKSIDSEGPNIRIRHIGQKADIEARIDKE
ncbi:Rne/Rng family ribonuclease [Pseudalkalibacillus berkeleyi]|uniref:Rne/Rng family ribonuclease n=1 Tax=Pseudalkalibacillus berkeleyi TaxID=1069813 RepID=A0ABS9H299_9BACL|nr:Rne/Rng family ribonuclease [Pseudalkalibacillus berkeleyi]MCF6138090.1 Rne/Rng family ribonuclease [Pseudalkalibacillus berkeleyi]